MPAVHAALAASVPTTVERIVTGGLVAVAAAVLLWNALTYPWERSYDASASTRYVQTLRGEHRLPDEADTSVWHNPPLYYAVAALAQPVADAVGLAPQRGPQLVSAAAALALVVLVLLLARELFPASPGARLAALAVAVGTPVLLRAGALYHPEALAAALAAGGLYVVVRGLARATLTWRAGLLAGVLLGLANLTRTWALAALAAALAGVALEAAWSGRRRGTVLGGVALAAAAAVFVAPWLAYKAVEHGSPLAYSQPIAEQWREDGRPASFYVDLALDDLFASPYAPHFLNRLVPVVYADWWGDYWRSWEVPGALHVRPDELPAEYERPRVVQAYAGLLPSAAALAGLVGLAAHALRRRRAAAAVVVLSGVLVAVSFAWFLVRYPKLDGDNIKALYVLQAAPAVALGAGLALDWLAGRHPALRGAVVAALGAVVAASLLFVVLPA